MEGSQSVRTSENGWLASEKEQVKIKSTLSPLRLALKPVPGDGSCLFNALSEGINHVSTGYDPGVLKTYLLLQKSPCLSI